MKLQKDINCRVEVALLLILRSLSKDDSGSTHDSYCMNDMLKSKHTKQNTNNNNNYLKLTTANLSFSLSAAKLCIYESCCRFMNPVCLTFLFLLILLCSACSTVGGLP